MRNNRLVGALLRGAAVVALGAGSAALIGVSPASATALGCGAAATSSTFGYALCSNGTGIGSDYYRVALTCRHQGSDLRVNGPWKLPTQKSPANCSIFSLTVVKG